MEDTCRIQMYRTRWLRIEGITASHATIIRIKADYEAHDEEQSETTHD